MKNLGIRLIYFLTSFLLIFTYSCTKDNSTPSKSVYVAGVYIPPGLKVAACYWKDEIFYPLEDGTKLSYANDILVKDGTVYVVGDFDGNPCVWINGTRYLLDPFQGFPGSLSSIANFNNQVYFGGTLLYANYNHGLITIGNSPLYLEGSSVHSYCSDILVNDDGTLMAGTKNNQAGYWSPGGRVDLGKSTQTTGLAIKGNTIFLSGTFDKLNNNIYDSGYWEADVFKSLGQFNITETTDLKINAGGQVLVVGSTAETINNDRKATLWKDGQAVLLSNNKSIASDIHVEGNNIYISGKDNDIACYWLNNKIHDLKTLNSAGTAIYVY